GSAEGDYGYSISLFDEVLVRGRTVKEVRGLSLLDLPRYKLGKESFYTIILDLGKDESVKADLNPYVFDLAF
ncbi:MAG: hypothetical protein WAU81_04950, partial [Candidatus Aminicenantales bacterium]